MYITFNKKTILSLLTNTGLTINANGDFLDFYVVDFEKKLRSYRALSFHVHSHAEHTIDQTRADLEIHIVCNETEASR
jgi:carbonic anhydrase